MTSENQEMAGRDLDSLLNEHFAGKIVRKDRRCCTALAESEIRLLWWPRYVRA